MGEIPFRCLVSVNAPLWAVRLHVHLAGRQSCVFTGLLVVARAHPPPALGIDAPLLRSLWLPPPTSAGWVFSHASFHLCPTHLCAFVHTPLCRLSTCVLPRAVRPWSH